LDLSGLYCYIVSYDIRDQKRLYQVHRAMLGFGQPVHYSVFRCDLTRLGRVEMASVLIDLIDEEEDRIMIIDMGPVDGRVAERIEFLGVHPTFRSYASIS
jgi:CRISPR-associated protein Cas2